MKLENTETGFVKAIKSPDEVKLNKTAKKSAKLEQKSLELENKIIELNKHLNKLKHRIKVLFWKGR